MVRAGQFSPNAGQAPANFLPGSVPRRRRSEMDYAGLLSQKRAEESSYRSGWDPIGSPAGLSRATLGDPYMADSYLGGGGLSASESALQSLDTFGTDGAFGGGLSGYQSNPSNGMSFGSSMPGDAGDPGAQRRQVQENYRRDLMKQAQADRARKQAEKERDQQVDGPLSTINKPSMLGASPAHGRMKSDIFSDASSPSPAVRAPPFRLAIIPGLETPRVTSYVERRPSEPVVAGSAAPSGLRRPRVEESVAPASGLCQPPTQSDFSLATPHQAPQECSVDSAGNSHRPPQGYSTGVMEDPHRPPQGYSTGVMEDPHRPPQGYSTGVMGDSQRPRQGLGAGATEDRWSTGQECGPSATESQRQILARLATSLGLLATGWPGDSCTTPGEQSVTPSSSGQELDHRCQEHLSRQLPLAPRPSQPPLLRHPHPIQYPNTAHLCGPHGGAPVCAGHVSAGGVHHCLGGGCGPAGSLAAPPPPAPAAPSVAPQCAAVCYPVPLAVGAVNYLPEIPRPPSAAQLAPPLPPIGTSGTVGGCVAPAAPLQVHPATAPDVPPAQPAQTIANAYGDELAMQLEERRQRQVRAGENLLTFNQQQHGGQDGFSFGDNTGSQKKNRPHVSETSYDRAQRSQAGTVQAELQQQIADKKRREAERKRLEAEEDAAVNARMMEQQRRMCEEVELEQNARQRKEQGRLKRQQLIEEQQRQALEQAEELKRANRGRKAGLAEPSATNQWNGWADDRSAGDQDPAPLKDLWKTETPQRQPTPIAQPSKPQTPPMVIHPSNDTADLKIGFDWDRSEHQSAANVRLDSPELDDLTQRNRERQRKLEERKRAN